MEESVNYFSEYYFNIGMALVIAIIGLLLATFAKRALAKMLGKNGQDTIVKTFIMNMVYTLIIILIAITSLSKLGVPTASLLTILGASSLAIALALKDSLANIAAGILLLINKPFKKGDFIETNGISGVVERINLFTTQLKTPVNESIYLPNSKLANDKIINKTAYATRRLDLAIGVSYDSKIQHVRELLTQLIEAEKRILTKPEPLVAVNELADSAITLTVRLWVRKADYTSTRFDMLEAIKQHFDQHNIVIPFPQREITIKQGDKIAT